MVNPDSDLYRAHPDWILAAPGYEPVTGRQQLQLDLGRAEVVDYLFDHLDRLLSEHPIRYFNGTTIAWHIRPIPVTRSMGCMS